MKTSILIIVATGLTAVLAACAAVAATGKKAASMPSFAGYSHWHLVNPTPYLAPAPIAAQCMVPMSSMPPHGNKYISVYVNGIATPAMASKSPVTYAAGSTIVKEKRAKPNGRIELLTVMVKGKPGSNPKTGDWEYFVTDPSGSHITASGNLQTCQDCHNTQKENDYVFGTYVPGKPTKMVRN